MTDILSLSPLQLKLDTFQLVKTILTISVISLRLWSKFGNFSQRD